MHVAKYMLHPALHNLQSTEADVKHILMQQQQLQPHEALYYPI